MNAVLKQSFYEITKYFFYCQDPGSDEEGTFFYNVTIKIKKNAMPFKILRETVQNCTLNVPVITGTEVDAKIAKCTNCGCGVETTSVYVLPLKPSRAQQVAKPETSK